MACRVAARLMNRPLIDKLVEGLHDYSTTKDTLTRLYIHTGKNVIFLLEKMLPCKLLKKIVFRQSWI